MKKQILSVCVMLLLIINASGQTIDLTFTSEDNGTYVQLDSIKVMNRTQGGDTVLFWPDTVLSLYVVGINEPQDKESAFQVFQNYPNPVTDYTTIPLFIPEKDKVGLIITDMLGRVILKDERMLDKGTHFIHFTPGEGNLYFFTAQWRCNSSSIKILQTASNSYGKSSLEYRGSEASSPQLKATADIQSFLFNLGDELLYIGYANGLQSGMLDAPEASETYTFQFATNIPCPGTPTVEYEGQIYNTIQIFSQCWLKENLNVGWMIPGSGNMTNNGFIEKYCYNDEPDSCTKYGGLYQWDEMMQYEIDNTIQGICPPGWHLPTDEEWKVLEGAVDSQYGIGDSEWDKYEMLFPGWRGFDAGINLKATNGWDANGNGTDLFGFSGPPSGYRFPGGNFNLLITKGLWWTSTESYSYSAWSRYLGFNDQGVFRDINDSKQDGLSVRCIRDMEPTTEFIDLTFTAIDNDAYVQLDSIKVMNRTHEGDKVLYYPDTTITLEFELTNYHTGDQLLLVGYYDTLQSGMLDIPEENKTYTFQFATNIPCPGTPTVTYEGQVYNTIQIFSQCWLKENLNVGMMIPGTQEMTDNDIIEKYCYNNEQDSCTKYGGLYQWWEMMQYTTQQGVQGICPPGWHLPTDEEWKVLEGAVDSQYGIGDPEWDNNFYRGYDAGTNLKTISGWYGGGNGTDLFGFSGLPGGLRGGDGGFYGNGGSWWTSTEGHNYLTAWHRDLGWSLPGVDRYGYWGKGQGFSVRCLRDY